MSILILFRSVTYAQRAQRALQRRGIGAEMTRAPLGHTDRGCGYALRLPERAREQAVGILEAEHIDFGRVLVRDGQGGWREP